MALHLTTVDGDPVTVELSDVASIQHALTGTLLLLHGGRTIVIRERDEELHALLLAERGQDPTTDAAPTPNR